MMRDLKVRGKHWLEGGKENTANIYTSTYPLLFEIVTWLTFLFTIELSV
jgi:hypothetical protein